MKKRWIAVLAAGAVCLGAAGIFLYIRLSGEGAQKAVAAYMEYIEEKEYDKMYDMLDEDSQALYSREEFVNRNRNIYEGIEAEHITVTFPEKQPKAKWTAYTTVMDTAAGEVTFDNQALVHREGFGWKLQWEDYLIHPKLTASDKVRVQKLPASRGDILTSDGKVMAGQGTVSLVGIVPGKLSGEEKDLEKLAELLEISVESIQTKLEASWVTDETFVPIKKVKKTDEMYQALLGENFTSEWEAELLSIPGVMMTDAEDRVYPMGEAAAHLVGYVQGITAEELEERQGKGYSQDSVLGKSGLEKLYEERLKGSDGCKIYIEDKNGNEKESIAMKLKKDGEDIVTTIDGALQQKLYQQYQKDNSCSVAVNPKTGAVLALVSTPSFDSSDFSMGMSQERWDDLNADENRPLTNRFRSLWCPGSSFKPVTAAVGMTSGKLSKDENLGYSGLSWQKDSTWGSYYVTTLHEYGEDVTLRNALVYSDNIYFAKAALKIGEDTFIEQMKHIGFGEELPFALGMEVSRYSNSEGMDSEIQLADSGYGQGQMMVNPLHLASIYTAFLNDGNMIRPYLEKKDEPCQIWIEGAFTKDAADTVKEDLIQVVEDPSGTGHGAYREELQLAGKTGTAEIKLDQQDTMGTELGWFVTFPVQAEEKDSFLLLTMVEDVKDRSGSGYVVDGTRQVLEDWLPSR
ncbi:MAG: penicillin-binding transpeptidase domain-containing protein [Blautia sp.]|jgi:cell division protein FtsI/penicillin-binding protein 2